MSFSLDLTNFIKKTKGNADIIIRKVGLDITKNIIKRTPIDTGRARANWQVGRTLSANQTEAKDKTGNNTTKKASEIINRMNAGGIFYIFNNLEYINRLEYGSSKQAPHGMVRITLKMYQRYIDAASKGLR